MANDWDLFAIVRSCSAAAAAKYPTRDGSGRNDEVGKNLFNLDGIFSYGDCEDDDRNEVDDDPLDELQHVYRPFYRKALPAGVEEDSAGGESENKHRPVESQAEKGKPEVPLQRQRQGSNAEDNGVGFRRRIPSQAPARRRKCRARLMMRMNAKTLSKDLWSWRKYGQKPIKGSPHPRNYYRCSTSKACNARKQIELSKDNPEEYIVSYIGEHIHACPITRRSAAATARIPPKPCSAAAATTAVTDLSPTTPLIAHYDNKNPYKGNENETSGGMFEEEEEGDILVPNMQISEETFMAMHVLNSRTSQSIVTKSHYPAKNPVKAAGSSG